MGFIKVKFEEKKSLKHTPCWGPIKALRAFEASTIPLAGIPDQAN